jgi:prepilin-type processing-associated H-X9-DG protein
MGWYGHKVGYNVLFGDGHVIWRADPNQWYAWEWNAVTDVYAGDMGGFGGGVTQWGLPAGNDAASDNDPNYNPATFGWWPGSLGDGAGIFTLFDDVANHEATAGFYLGEWVSNYQVPPTN